MDVNRSSVHSAAAETGVISQLPSQATQGSEFSTRITAVSNSGQLPPPPTYQQTVNLGQFASGGAASSSPYPESYAIEMNTVSSTFAREPQLNGARVRAMMERFGEHFNEFQKNIIHSSLQGLNPGEAEACQQVINELEAVIVAACTGAGPLTGLGRFAASVQRDINLASRDAYTPTQRSQLVLEVLGNLQKESNADCLKRYGKNIGILALRTGLIVATLTTTRQIVGFATEQALLSAGATATTRAFIGTSISLIGPVLNIVGLMLDETRGTATATSRAARLQMLVTSGMGIAAMYLSGSYGGVTAALLSQVASYTLSRDFVQMFAPLESNATGGDPAALALAQTAYGFIQVLVGQAMSYGAPDSGAGAVGRMDLSMTLGDSVIRGGINGLGEMMDDFVSKSANRVIETSRNQAIITQAVQSQETITVDSHAILWELAQVGEKAEIEARASGLTDDALQNAVTSKVREAAEKLVEGLRLGVSLRLPTVRQMSDQLFTTSAMRTSAFSAVYAISIAANALTSPTITPAVSGLMNDLLVGATLSYIYAPFSNAHVQQEVQPAQAFPDGVRRRHREASSNISGPL